MLRDIITAIHESYRKDYAHDIKAILEAETIEQRQEALKGLNGKIIDSWKDSITKAKDKPIGLALAHNAFPPSIVFDESKGIQWKEGTKAKIGMSLVLTGEALKDYEKVLACLKEAYNESFKFSQKPKLNTAFQAFITFSSKHLQSVTVSKQVLDYALQAVKQWYGIESKTVNYKTLDKSLLHAIARSVTIDKDILPCFNDGTKEGSSQSKLSRTALEKAVANTEASKKQEQAKAKAKQEAEIKAKQEAEASK